MSLTTGYTTSPMTNPDISDNTRRFEFIDSVLNGLEAFHYRKENDLEDAFFGDEKLMKSFPEFMIMFSLEGGTRQWFKNRDMIMKKEKEDGKLNMSLLYLVDQIGIIGLNRSGDSDFCIEEMSDLFKEILEGGIYDKIFLCYENPEECIKMFEECVDYNLKFVYGGIEKASKLVKNVFYDLQDCIRKRIRKVFSV